MALRVECKIYEGETLRYTTNVLWFKEPNENQEGGIVSVRIAKIFHKNNAPLRDYLDTLPHTDTTLEIEGNRYTIQGIQSITTSNGRHDRHEVMLQDNGDN